MSPDWILTDTGLVQAVVPGDRLAKMGFGDRFGHGFGFEYSAELLVNGKWDAGNLSHEVRLQLIKLFVVYCDEMPTEAHTLEAKWLLHLTVTTVMMTLKTVV